MRFADTTLIDLAAGGTPVDLEFGYTLSAQAKLVLIAHEVYLPKPKLAVEGPGGVQASFDFRGAKNDVAGRMLTVTLTNARNVRASGNQSRTKAAALSARPDPRAAAACDDVTDRKEGSDARGIRAMIARALIREFGGRGSRSRGPRR